MWLSGERLALSSATATKQPLQAPKTAAQGCGRGELNDLHANYGAIGATGKLLEAGIAKRQIGGDETNLERCLCIESVKGAWLQGGGKRTDD